MIRLAPSFRVRLSPATSLDVIDSVWPLVASTTLPQQPSDTWPNLRLFVRRNADGRVLLYLAANEHGPGTPPAVLTTAVEASRAIRSLTDLVSLTTDRGADCLQEFGDH